MPTMLSYNRVWRKIWRDVVCASNVRVQQRWPPLTRTPRVVLSYPVHIHNSAALSTIGKLTPATTTYGHDGARFASSEELPIVQKSSDSELQHASERHSGVEKTDTEGGEKPLNFIQSLHKQLQISDVDSTLDLVTVYYKQMVTEHVFHSIMKLYNHLKTLSNSELEGAITELKSDKRFHMLCVVAAKKGQFNTARQVLRTVNLLSLMNFDGDNKIVQIFLELGKHHVNSYNCREIVHFGFLLTKFAETEQISLLKQQLTLALKLKLYKEVHMMNSPQLCNLLEAFGDGLKQRHIASVLDALLLQKDSSKFTHPVLVLRILADLKQRDPALIKVCLHHVKRLLDKKSPSLNSDAIFSLLNSLGQLGWYNVHLFSDFAKHVCQEELSFVELAKFLDRFLACRFCPKVVIDKFISVLESEIDNVDISSLDEVNMLLRPLALSNWRDGRLGKILMKLLDAAEAVVRRDSEEKTEGFYRNYPELLVNLLVLGYRTQDLPIQHHVLEQCVGNIKDLPDLQTQVESLHELGIVFLAHKAHTGEYVESSTLLKQTIDEVITKKNMLIQPVLTAILGRDMFIVDKVFESGLLLNQVFAIYKEGPVPKSDLITEAEDGEKSVELKPATSNSQQRYAISLIRNKHVMKNMRCVTGPIQLQLDLLTQLGYHTVLIEPSAWNAVPERERPDFLNSRIEMAGKDDVAYII